MVALSNFGPFYYILTIYFLLCESKYTVWSDDLDERNNNEWKVSGSINDSIHFSNNCPSSNDCWQLESISSITNSIPTNNYLNLTLQFGITIIDHSLLQSPIKQNNNSTHSNLDFCQIYYKINKDETNISTNWSLLTSYSFDINNHFNNKLPLQIHSLPISDNNQYYQSIDIRFENTANNSDSNLPFSCYFDQISLMADYHNSSSSVFQIDTMCMSIYIDMFVFFIDHI